MTINIKNFLSDKKKLSKMEDFQSLKKIEGLEMSSFSADLYENGRDDLALFYFTKGANYATLTTTNTITSEFENENSIVKDSNLKSLVLSKRIKDSAVVIQNSFDVIILIPVKNNYFRLFGIFFFCFFHIGLNMTMNIGWFQIVSIIMLAVFIPSNFWDYILKKLSNKERLGLEIYYDNDCSFCKRIVFTYDLLLFETVYHCGLFLSLNNPWF